MIIVFKYIIKGKDKSKIRDTNSDDKNECAWHKSELQLIGFKKLNANINVCYCELER